MVAEPANTMPAEGLPEALFEVKKVELEEELLMFSSMDTRASLRSWH
jgi:hypothetical protein